MEQKLLEDNKFDIPIETIKKEFHKKRRDGEKAFTHLNAAKTVAKHMMVGHMGLGTRDWR